VVGQGTGASNVVLWQNNTLTTLGSYSAFGDTVSRMDINDAGQVVAGSSLWSDGTIAALGSPEQKISIYGINNSGQIVGDYIHNPTDPDYQHQRHAFLWDNDLNNLGTLGGNHSAGFALNNWGQVAGSAFAADGQADGFFWDGQPMQQLGAGLGIFAVNDVAQIVGFNGDRAFLWDNGTMQDLGTLGGTVSWAYGINNLGQVVGYAERSDRETSAFLWENSTMYDLNDYLVNDGWRLLWTTDINDKGQIVGVGEYQDGTMRSFLLNPVASQPQEPVNVPEPAMSPGLMLGLVALGKWLYAKAA